MLLLTGDLLWFVAVLLGPTLAAQRWIPRADPLERFALALGLALIALYLAVFGLYLAGESLHWSILLPILAWLLVLRQPDRGWRDPHVRGAAGRWLCLAAWVLGWQAIVTSYSGALWCNDWVEHYDRVHFFLARWPADFLFLNLYPLPARPPLANLDNAALMAWTGGGFAHFQIFNSLFSSLVYFPLAVLLRLHGAGRRKEILLLGLLMLNPLFVQNATFPWTKLTTACFVLLAVTQLIPRGDGQAGSRLLFGGLMLAGGMLAHYSAGPWIVALGAAWIWAERRAWREVHRWRQALGAAGVAALLLATWVGWSVTRYGAATTLAASNTGVPPPASWLEPVVTGALNLGATLSPISQPPESHGLVWIREYWFGLYQLKLPFAFGVAGVVLLGWRLARLRRSAATDFWLIAVPVVVILGTITHLRPDNAGLVHISLSPLVLLGLAWLVLESDTLPAWLRRLWLAGLAVDFLCGIALHFALQAFWPQQILHPGDGIGSYLADYPYAARTNWESKLNLRLDFLADVMTPWLGPGLVLTAGLIVLGMLRLNPSAATVAPPDAGRREY